MRLKTSTLFYAEKNADDGIHRMEQAGWAVRQLIPFEAHYSWVELPEVTIIVVFEREYALDKAQQLLEAQQAF